MPSARWAAATPTILAWSLNTGGKHWGTYLNARYKTIDQIGLIQLLDPPAQRTSCFIVAPCEITVSDFAHAGYALGHELAFGDRFRSETLRNGAHGHALALSGELGAERGQRDGFLRGRGGDRARSQLARCIADHRAAITRDGIYSKRLGKVRKRVIGRDHEHMPQRSDRPCHEMRQVRRLACRADHKIRAARDQCVPGAAEHFSGQTQPRIHLQVVERVYIGPESIERQDLVDTDSQLRFPAFLNALRPLFQLLGGQQQPPAVLDHDTSRVREPCAPPGAIEQRDVEIAFELLDEVTE